MLQRVLRMLVADEQLSAVVVEIDVDVRQHDDAFRQAQTTFISSRVVGANRRAGDDDRALRRVGLQRAASAWRKRRAMFGRIADALLLGAPDQYFAMMSRNAAELASSDGEIDLLDQFGEFLPIDLSMVAALSRGASSSASAMARAGSSTPSLRDGAAADE